MAQQQQHHTSPHTTTTNKDNDNNNVNHHNSSSNNNINHAEKHQAQVVERALLTCSNHAAHHLSDALARIDA